MNKIILIGLVLLTYFPAVAQQGTTSNEDYLENELIDYSLLLKYKDSIGLSANQLTQVKEFYQKYPFDLNASKRSYQSLMRELNSSINAGKNEKEVINLFDRALEYERNIKLHRLRFLLAAKQILNDNQRKQLRLIGKSNDLTETYENRIFGQNLTVIKPIYRLLDSDGDEIYVDDEQVGQIGINSIKSIDIQKSVDVLIDGVTHLNSNLITVKVSTDIILEEQIKEGEKIAKIDGENQVRIRGYIGAVNKNSPLFIIKHKGKTRRFKGDKEFAQINPNNIKAITVLKDQAAIDIYGKQGENGVVVIELKQKPKGKVKKGS